MPFMMSLEGKKDFPSKKQLNQTSVAQMVPRASIVT